MVLFTFSTILRVSTSQTLQKLTPLIRFLQEIHILTDVWIYDVDLREKLETKITEIFLYISKYKIEIPEESCLVLAFKNTGRCGYYFVNHAEQRLFWQVFWLDEYHDGMDFLFEVKVEYTPSLVGEFF
jgi:hypothetical protein